MYRYIFSLLKNITIIVLFLCLTGAYASISPDSISGSISQSLLNFDGSDNPTAKTNSSYIPQYKFSCSDNNSVSKEKFAALVDELSPVWSAVSERNEPKLLDYLSNESHFVRETAWRGLANMTVANVSRLFDNAMNDSLEIKWFTLSNQTLLAEHLRKLESLALDSDSDILSGIYLVMGQKGDSLTHKFLLSEVDTSTDKESEYNLALAVGRSILRNREVSVPNMLLLKRAMSTQDSRTQAAWMYPWYRSADLKPSAETLDVLGQWSSVFFDEAYGLVRQYMINILGKIAHPTLITLMQDRDLTELHPLEAIELAKALYFYPESPQVAQLRLRLSLHLNPYVRVELLQGITRLQNQPSDEYKNEILSRLSSEVADPYEWLWHIRALGKWWADDAQQLLENDSHNWTDDPHYTTDYLETIKSIYSTEKFLSELEKWSYQSDDAILVPVINQLTMIVMINPEDLETRKNVGNILTDIAKNEGYRISLALHASNLALDWTSDRSDERLLKHIQAGELLSAVKPELNVPDVDRIKELGSHPIWVLRTSIGEIVMRLDTYRTPATVSTFAGLVEDGWYDGTPFHRVVHNFVVQGGAIWHPDYTNENPFRVPTEGTELEFSRGAVGVASAGRDTETSQFFMMHMWAPHLNGLYSNIGRVIEGEDVIDQLTQGTIVVSSSMYGCY